MDPTHNNADNYIQKLCMNKIISSSRSYNTIQESTSFEIFTLTNQLSAQFF